MMTTIIQTLKVLAQHSQNVEYLPMGFKGLYTVSSVSDVKFLLKIEDNSSLKIDFDFKEFPFEEDFEIGKPYSYNIKVMIPEVRSSFFSNPKDLVKYILGKTEKIEWSEKIVLPFEQKFHPVSCNYQTYFIYLNRLIVLYKNHTYYDSARFVLFTDEPFLVPLMREETSFDTIKSCFDEIDINKFKESIEYLESFLDDEEIEAHQKKKQAVFIAESTKILGSKVHDRFYNLIKKIDEIRESVDKSFKIYLENFSYKRLELELKKDLDYFIKSINDSIGALQSQALGLPVAAALTQFSKVGSESESSSLLYTPYLALIAFSVFVAFNVYQQDLQVQYSKASIVRFFKKDAVSSIISTDTSLSLMRKLIDKRICVINSYMIMIFLMAITVIVYALYELRLLTWLPS